MICPKCGKPSYYELVPHTNVYSLTCIYHGVVAYDPPGEHPPMGECSRCGKPIQMPLKRNAIYCESCSHKLTGRVSY